MVETILSLLRSNGSIIINKNLMRNIGTESTIMFSELCSKYNYWQIKEGLTSDGYFYCTAEDMEDSSGLSNYQQKIAVKRLVGLKLIEYKVAGLPPKAHYKIIATEELLRVNLKNLSTNLKNLKIEIKKFNTNNNTINNTINNNTNEILTQSVSTKEDTFSNDTKEEERGKVNLFDLAPLPIKDTSFSSNKNHTAVKRFKSKITNNEWNISKFTDTDWMIGFIACYNEVYPKQYDLEPSGSNFNVVVKPFNALIDKIPKELRREMFTRILQNACINGNIAKTWQTGFVLKQFTDGINKKKLMENIDHQLSIIAMKDREKTVTNIVNNMPKKENNTVF